MKICFLCNEEIIFLIKQNADIYKSMRNFMLTSILLETKYVTTLWEISSSLRNFQTFKCHEKALSKPYQLHSSKLCLEIRYVKFFPTHFFRLKFILAARAWRFCAVTGSFKRQQVRWIQKLYYLTQKNRKCRKKSFWWSYL